MNKSRTPRFHTWQKYNTFPRSSIKISYNFIVFNVDLMESKVYFRSLLRAYNLQGNPWGGKVGALWSINYYLSGISILLSLCTDMPDQELSGCLVLSPCGLKKQVFLSVWYNCILLKMCNFYDQSYHCLRSCIYKTLMAIPNAQ